MSEDLNSLFVQGVRDVYERVFETDNKSSNQVRFEQVLKDFEKRSVERLKESEAYILGQVEEISIALTMTLSITILTAVYVLYFLVQNVVRRSRSCVTRDSWDMVVRAARFQIQCQNDNQHINNINNTQPSEVKSN